MLSFASQIGQSLNLSLVYKYAILRSMAKQNGTKINWLEKHLPEGLLVDAAWLGKHGYSTSLRSQYVSAGWLEQPTRQVYRRQRGSLKWEHVVISLQALLEYPLVVGGRTALDLQGYSHYLTRTTNEVHLYGPEAPPHWLQKLSLKTRYRYHNSRKLFAADHIGRLPNLDWDPNANRSKVVGPRDAAVVTLPWGAWDWPLTVSTPERAILELLDELPKYESFHQADQLMDGLRSLSPRRLQRLLAECHSVKVKRLFFFFAERHKHAWLKKLDKHEVDFGKGKRMLAKGGKLDRSYQITVPEDLNAVQ